MRQIEHLAPVGEREQREFVLREGAPVPRTQSPADRRRTSSRGTLRRSLLHNSPDSWKAIAQIRSKDSGVPASSRPISAANCSLNHLISSLIANRKVPFSPRGSRHAGGPGSPSTQIISRFSPDHCEASHSPPSKNPSSDSSVKVSAPFDHASMLLKQQAGLTCFPVFGPIIAGKFQFSGC